MKAKLISRLLSVVALSAVWVWLLVQPMPAYAWPCCSELNCEGEYEGCVEWCTLYHSGSDTCMDDCYTDANFCRLHNCSYCENRVPCWFGESFETPCKHPQTYESCAGHLECVWPSLCVEGAGGPICVTAGCTRDDQCSTGHVCVGGMCSPRQCTSDSDCPQGPPSWHCNGTSCVP